MSSQNFRVFKWLCIAGGALMVAFGVAASLLVAPISDPAAVHFTKLADWVLFGYYVGIFTGGVTLALPWIWSIVRRIAKLRSEIASKIRVPDTRKITLELSLLYATFILVIIVGQYRAALRQPELVPIPGWPLRISATLAAGLLICGPSVIGLWLGGFSAASIRSFAASLPQGGDAQINWGREHIIAVAHLVDLAVLQKRLLAFLSAAVSSLVIGPGLLRAAELAWNPRAQLPSSAQSLVSFGGLFAVFIAVSYAPTLVIGEDARRELLAKITPLPPNGALSAEWCQNRDIIERVVLPRNSLGTAVQIAIAVFAPVVAGLATSLYSLR